MWHTTFELEAWMKKLRVIYPFLAQKIEGFFIFVPKLIILFQVHIKAPFILNGVCVLWQGWINLQTLEGMGSIQFDAEAAKIEDSIMKKQVQLYNQCCMPNFTKLL